MRIDIAAHVGRWPFRPMAPWDVAGLLRRMDATGVELALVANLHGLFYQNPQHANAELASWIRSEPAAAARLLPFAVLNPTYPGWREDLAVCREEFGFRGLRLYPQYHDYSWQAPELAECLALAAERNLPVAFSLRMIDARGRSWLDTPVVEGETDQLRLEALSGAIEQFPALRVIVLQSIFEQLSEHAVAVLQGARVLFDTSRATTVGIPGPNSYDLPSQQTRFGAAKFAFGSMSPFTDVLSPVARITAGGLPGDVTEGLFSGNARRFLGL